MSSSHHGRWSLIVVAVVVVVVSLVCVQHSSACQSGIDNNVTTAASTEEEVTTGTSESTKTAIITSEQEDEEGRRDLANRKRSSEDSGGRSSTAAEVEEGGGRGEDIRKGPLRKEEVKKFIRDYMRWYDQNISTVVDVFFGPEASLNIIGPLMPEASGKEDHPIPWKEMHFKGNKAIETAMSGGFYACKTTYKFVSFQEAQAFSMFVIVEGTQTNNHLPTFKFSQQFLVQRDYWCPYQMRIRYSTLTRGFLGAQVSAVPSEESDLEMLID
eukprot:GHVS01029617.1.p1 GENE.GHVS01029617.1~~GHVS01029617.1.p1  ORF type:complete len:270 (+),score=54.86 GHVS01029617.1:96-905(+)